MKGSEYATGLPKGRGGGKHVPLIFKACSAEVME